MESSKKFNLVDGKFDVKDATSIVLSFFNTKITFHNHQLLKMAENGVKDLDVIEKKIDQIKHTRNCIIELISEANSPGQLLEIEGFITIKKA